MGKIIAKIEKFFKNPIVTSFMAGMLLVFGFIRLKDHVYVNMTIDFMVCIFFLCYSIENLKNRYIRNT